MGVVGPFGRGSQKGSRGDLTATLARLEKRMKTPKALSDITNPIRQEVPKKSEKELGQEKGPVLAPRDKEPAPEPTEVKETHKKEVAKDKEIRKTVEDINSDEELIGDWISKKPSNKARIPMVRSPGVFSQDMWE